MWDPLTCKLRRDLPYQAVVDEERFMAHDGAIHALAFTKDGELLASAAADGKVHFSSAPALSELFFFNFAKYLL